MGRVSETTGWSRSELVIVAMVGLLGALAGFGGSWVGGHYANEAAKVTAQLNLTAAEDTAKANLAASRLSNDTTLAALREGFAQQRSASRQDRRRDLYVAYLAAAQYAADQDAANETTLRNTEAQVLIAGSPNVRSKAGALYTVAIQGGTDTAYDTARTNFILAAQAEADADD